MNVLVVIPTYNEEPNIARMLSAVRSVAPEVSILVVDDGSPDRTDVLVEQAAQQLGQISLLRREAKSGLGSAYRAGFAWGIKRGFDTFVEIDADFSHDPNALPKLLEKAGEGADVVIGSRYVRGGTIPDWSWHRHLLSWSGNKYASLMLRLGVADATAGYRVYRSDILTRMDYPTVAADGYGFQIEMTYRARRSGASIVEIPITFIDREMGESKMSSSIITEALILVTRWGFDRLRGRAWSPSV